MTAIEELSAKLEAVKKERDELVSVIAEVVGTAGNVSGRVWVDAVRWLAERAVVAEVAEAQFAEIEKHCRVFRAAADGHQ
jgi:hypothetical protein